MLTKSIYVSEVNNLSDARYCSGMGVDFIGICVDEQNPNYLTFDKFKEISSWIVGVNWVIESDSTSIENIILKCKEYGINRARVNEMIISKQLMSEGVEVIIKADELPSELFEEELFLGFDLPYSESLFDSLQNREKDALPRIYLRGATSIQNLEQINSTQHVYGAILIGGDELRPGFKDMDALIDAIEVFEE